MLSNKAKRELKINQRRILIDSIEIAIPSPQQVLNWGERKLPNGKKVGEVKNSKTVNYKKFTPLRDGLFCERIFGPVTSFVCACGKRQSSSDVTFCDKCEVEYIDKRVRRSRLGYISLVSPVVHVWYLKGRPSYLSLFLGKRKKQMLALAYCNAYLVEQAFSKIDQAIQGPVKPNLKKYQNSKQTTYLKNQESTRNESRSRLQSKRSTKVNASVDDMQSLSQIRQLSNKFHKSKRIISDPTFFKEDNETNPATVLNVLKSQDFIFKTNLSTESKDSNLSNSVSFLGKDLQTNKTLSNLPLTDQTRVNKLHQANFSNLSVNKGLLDSFFHVFADILNHTKNNLVLSNYAHTLPSLLITKSQNKQLHLLDFYLRRSTNSTSFFDLQGENLTSSSHQTSEKADPVDLSANRSGENQNQKRTVKGIQTNTPIRGKEIENFFKNNAYSTTKKYQTTAQKLENVNDFTKQKITVKEKEKQSILLKGISLPILRSPVSRTNKSTLITKEYFLNFFLPSYLWYQKRYLLGVESAAKTKSQSDFGHLLTSDLTPTVLPFENPLLNESIGSKAGSKVKNESSEFKNQVKSTGKKSILKYFTKRNTPSSLSLAEINPTEDKSPESKNPSQSFIKSNSKDLHAMQSLSPSSPEVLIPFATQKVSSKKRSEAGSLTTPVERSSSDGLPPQNSAVTKLDKEDICFFLEAQTPEKQIKVYNRAQSVPFLPSLICKYNVREELVTFFNSSPVESDLPIPFYCEINRWEALYDVHKFMAEQTLSSSTDGSTSALLSSNRFQNASKPISPGGKSKIENRMYLKSTSLQQNLNLNKFSRSSFNKLHGLNSIDLSTRLKVDGKNGERSSFKNFVFGTNSPFLPPTENPSPSSPYPQRGYEVTKGGKGNPFTLTPSGLQGDPQQGVTKGDKVSKFAERKPLSAELNFKKISENFINSVDSDNEKWKHSVTKSIQIASSIQALKTYYFDFSLSSLSAFSKSSKLLHQIANFNDDTILQNPHYTVAKTKFLKELNSDFTYAKQFKGFNKAKTKRVFTLGKLLNLSCHFAWRKFNSTLGNNFPISQSQKGFASDHSPSSFLPITLPIDLQANRRKEKGQRPERDHKINKRHQGLAKTLFLQDLLQSKRSVKRSFVPSSPSGKTQILVPTENLSFLPNNPLTLLYPPQALTSPDLLPSTVRNFTNLPAEIGSKMYRSPGLTKSKIFRNLNFSILLTTQVANRLPKMFRKKNRLSADSEALTLFQKGKVRPSLPLPVGRSTTEGKTPNSFSIRSLQTPFSNILGNKSSQALVINDLESYKERETNSELLANISIFSRDFNLASIYSRLFYLLFTFEKRLLHNVYTPFFEKSLKQISFQPPVYRNYVSINNNESNDLVFGEKTLKKYQKTSQYEAPLSLFLILPRLKSSTISNANNVVSLAVQKFNPIFESFCQQKIEKLSTLSDTSLSNRADFAKSKNSKLYMFLETRNLNFAFNTDLLPTGINTGLFLGNNEKEKNFITNQESIIEYSRKGLISQKKSKLGFDLLELTTKNSLNISNVQIQPSLDFFTVDTQEGTPDGYPPLQVKPMFRKSKESTNVEEREQERGKMLWINRDSVSRNKISQFVLTRNLLFATLVANKRSEYNTPLDDTVSERTDFDENQENLKNTLNIPKESTSNVHFEGYTTDSKKELASNLNLEKEFFLASRMQNMGNISPKTLSQEDWGLELPGTFKPQDNYLNSQKLENGDTFTDSIHYQGFSKRYNSHNSKNNAALNNNENLQIPKQSFGIPDYNVGKQAEMLSHLELNTIREILAYTGGGALEAYLKRIDVIAFFTFLSADIAATRITYKGKLAKIGYGNQVNRKQKRVLTRLAKRISINSRRLKIVQLFMRNKRRPEWMMISLLPVLPPDLRPILQMSESVVVASDINNLYQRVIYRNNRFHKLGFIDSHLVTAIQRLVQDAVDRLIENGKGASKPFYTPAGRPLKSLSDTLKGKKGRFRYNLLGKRVDFSGRSVIVVSPQLRIQECGLPKEIALELYHYFLLRQILLKKQASSIVIAKKLIKERKAPIWNMLRDIIYHHPVLLNRAPTLHRLGIQAFQPKLIDGNAIWLHPLVCSAFNADFDGDQMGVHLPLSLQARAEAWDLLWSRNNLLSPATGQPVLVPSQDMVLGFYYMTQSFASPSLYLEQNLHKGIPSNTKDFFDGRSKRVLNLRQLSFSKQFFFDRLQLLNAFQSGQITIHTPVWLALKFEEKFEHDKAALLPLELRLNTFGNSTYIYSEYKRRKDESTSQLTSCIRTTAGKVLVNMFLS